MTMERKKVEIFNVFFWEKCLFEYVVLYHFEVYIAAEIEEYVSTCRVLFKRSYPLTINV